MKTLTSRLDELVSTHGDVEIIQIAAEARQEIERLSRIVKQSDRAEKIAREDARGGTEGQIRAELRGGEMPEIPTVLVARLRMEDALRAERALEEQVQQYRDLEESALQKERELTFRVVKDRQVRALQSRLDEILAAHRTLSDATSTLMQGMIGAIEETQKVAVESNLAVRASFIQLARLKTIKRYLPNGS